MNKNKRLITQEYGLNQLVELKYLMTKNKHPILCRWEGNQKHKAFFWRINPTNSNLINLRSNIKVFMVRKQN
ncbi:unnamed protein product [Paramecium primaurelia]|uniref:Uncharacterized protein n=1 Tax=Paramecium primaurelia TaxID=5886 RepID=A0A8S1MLH4_PARPR|nr:unnamed protein product [Paramecium primaurelia]